jgi:DNA-binding beta-propeller fold protein YncE
MSCELTSSRTIVPFLLALAARRFSELSARRCVSLGSVVAFSWLIAAPLAAQSPAVVRAPVAPPACYATPTSLTPPSWHAPAPVASLPPKGGLVLLREIPLPGPPNRFDYQSFDPSTRRLYINHMGAGRTVVFDTDSNLVLTEIKDVPRATGVLAVPSLHRVYVSAAGAHQVVIIDNQTLTARARVGGIRFPDGIAYASETGKIFVSDESGEADVVIDATTDTKRSTIALGGEAGNTHYDPVSHCILVALQTRNQIVAIDPVSEKVVRRYDLPGSNHPHGFVIDADDRLAFVSSEGNAVLQVLDLQRVRVITQHRVGDSPDVLAWDPGLKLLYVASESGVLSVFWLEGNTLTPAGELRAPHMHTVSVDPRTHRVYVPLENVNGHPVLRIYQPSR